MGEIREIVEAVVKKVVKVQLGLVYIDIKELKEENRNLKQKHFELLRRIKAIEEHIRQKKPEENGTDFGV